MQVKSFSEDGGAQWAGCIEERALIGGAATGTSAAPLIRSCTVTEFWGSAVASPACLSVTSGPQNQLCNMVCSQYLHCLLLSDVTLGWFSMEIHYCDGGGTYDKAAVPMNTLLCSSPNPEVNDSQSWPLTAHPQPSERRSGHGPFITSSSSLQNIHYKGTSQGSSHVWHSYSRSGKVSAGKVITDLSSNIENSIWLQPSPIYQSSVNHLSIIYI